MAKPPRLTAKEVAKLPAELREAIRICDRWEGLRVGDPVPCRSNLIGRTVELKPTRREPRGLVEIVGCAVPKSERPSKRCKVAYLVKPLKGQGMLPFVHAVDSGKVKNATRAQRPTHTLSHDHLTDDRDDPYFYRQLGLIQRENEAEGSPRMLGLDIPYRHRVGSSICCPDHPWSALALSEDLRWAREGEAMSPELVRKVLGLGRHLVAKHEVRGLVVPASLAPDDFDTAEAILSASDAYCGDYLIAWEQQQEADAKARREAPRKRRKSTTAADKAKRKRAVQRSMRHTRAELMRGLTGGK